MSVCGHMHVSADAHRSQKGALDLPELELQVVVTCPICVWEPNSSPLQEQ